MQPLNAYLQLRLAAKLVVPVKVYLRKGKTLHRQRRREKQEIEIPVGMTSCRSK